MRTRATCAAASAVCAVLSLAAYGCATKSSPSEAGASTGTAATKGTPVASATATSRLVPFGGPRLLPPDAGVGDAGLLPPVLTPPDWDLSADDPGRDYARRYVLFTQRYPDLACAEFSPSVPLPDVKQVTVKTAATCPGAGTVRDVFLVDVAGDHLTVDDKTRRAPLARWPDGSDPEAPPGVVIRETTNMRGWKSPIQDALLKLSLAPMRMQSYGRGTYPVVSLAGWHAPYLLNAPPDALQPLSDALCAANDNMPMALVAGFDRAHVLRIRCPSATKWDTLK